MTLLEEIKLSLGGINHSKLDDEITQTIRAACLDMQRVGILDAEDLVKTDPLARQCVKLYCRGNYNYQGQGERWAAAYESARDSLSLSVDYNGKGSPPC